MARRNKITRIEVTPPEGKRISETRFKEFSELAASFGYEIHAARPPEPKSPKNMELVNKPTITMEDLIAKNAIVHRELIDGNVTKRLLWTVGDNIGVGREVMSRTFGSMLKDAKRENGGDYLGFELASAPYDSGSAITLTSVHEVSLDVVERKKHLEGGHGGIGPEGWAYIIMTHNIIDPENRIEV